MISNKKLNQIVTELLIRGMKLKIYTIFITPSYLAVPKDVNLNCTHFFIINIQDKQELSQIAFNHSSDTEFKDFVNLYKNIQLNHTCFS